jgi:predicted neutral ceramidase superfamily lipid hydrolase
VSALQRNIGQKISLVTAIFCAFLSLPVFASFLWLWQERGMQDTWTPSALTTTFFFLFCSVVLYVMSRPKPHLPQDDATTSATTTESTAGPRVHN